MHEDSAPRIVALNAWEVTWLRAVIRDVLKLSTIVPDAKTHVRLEQLLDKIGPRVAEQLKEDKRTMALQGGTPDRPEILRGPADDTGQYRVDVVIPEDREY